MGITSYIAMETPDVHATRFDIGDRVMVPENASLFAGAGVVTNTYHGVELRVLLDSGRVVYVYDRDVV